MDLSKIAPIIEDIVKESLSEKVYLYGRFQRSLTSRVASGRLRSSIKAVIMDNKQGVQTIQVQAFGQPLSNTYAYWLAEGRKPNGDGGFANIGAIEQWIKDKKSFKIRDYKTGKFLPKNEKNIKNTAFVVARSIGRFGYQNKPKNFVEISYDLILKNTEITRLIEDAGYDELLKALEGL
jgi:hypothetical protein